MKPALQTKLLHVLQDGEFSRLGSNRRQTVDVRVLAATNRDLERMMLAGEFREDLYYRLKVIEIMVPSLRERRDEIAPLTDFFLAKYTHKYNRPVPQMSDELRQLFQEYDWPGNIRELENVVKRLVILQDEQLVIREIRRIAARMPVLVGAGAPAPAASGVDLGGDLDGGLDAAADDEETAEAVDAAPAPPPAPGTRTLAEVAKEASLRAERTLIEETLRQMHWNRRKAAQALGVSYKTLLNKIKECGISRR
jgi:DNA-binding NtrC family response regulator